MLRTKKSRHHEKEFIESIKRKRTELINHHKIIIDSFNGSNYENQFIFKSKRLNFESVLDSFGLIQLTLKEKYIEFRDSMRMTGVAKLTKLCSDYKLPEKFSKTEYPHKFASRANMYYVGKVPEGKYWESGEIPEEWKGEEKEFNNQKVRTEYNKLDTISDCIIQGKLRKLIKEITGLDTNDFITAPSLAYHYMMESIPPDLVYLTSDRAVDAFIRKSFQGGRVFPQISCYKSRFAKQILEVKSMIGGLLIKIKKSEDKIMNKQDVLVELESKIGSDEEISPEELRLELDKAQQELEKLYKECDDYYLVLDAVSLYPSAMYLFEYPVGIPYWADGEDGRKSLEEVRDAMNNYDENFPLGIIECSIDIPRDNIDINKKRASNVKDPAYLGAFVFAYARKIMNRCINTFGGFTDWNNTFAYTDTDL